MNIDNVNIHDFPVSLAPMEDVTDIAFRIVCKRLGADILYTEFTSSEAMITNDEKFRAAMATGWDRIGADVKYAFENIKALFTMNQ